MIKRVVTICVALFLSKGALSKEIVVGVEFRPEKNWALMITPLVITDPISVKLALEYRVHRKLNFVFPMEAKWMDYRWAIKGVGNLFKVEQNIPEYWYRDNAAIKVGWNIDYSHLQFSQGFGVKYFPFGESMKSAFFIKTTALIGIERFNAYAAEGERDSMVLSHNLSIGYTWVPFDMFSFGFELGEEYVFHTNPIDKMPQPFLGFAPVLQAFLGFNI